MNFSTWCVRAAWGLVREFRVHAGPLTCSPPTSAVVMAMMALGGVCISVLEEKQRSGLLQWSSFLQSVASTLTLQFRAQECDAGLAVSSSGSRVLVKCILLSEGEEFIMSAGVLYVMCSDPAWREGARWLRRGIRTLYLRESVKLSLCWLHPSVLFFIVLE